MRAPLTAPSLGPAPVQICVVRTLSWLVSQSGLPPGMICCLEPQLTIMSASVAQAEAIFQNRIPDVFSRCVREGLIFTSGLCARRDPMKSIAAQLGARCTCLTCTCSLLQAITVASI